MHTVWRAFGRASKMSAKIPVALAGNTNLRSERLRASFRSRVRRLIRRVEWYPVERSDRFFCQAALAFEFSAIKPDLAYCSREGVSREFVETIALPYHRGCHVIIGWIDARPERRNYSIRE